MSGHSDSTLDQAARMARMEANLDNMAGAIEEMRELMSRMVRVEERNAQTDKAIKRMGGQIDDLQSRVRQLEGGQAGNRVMLAQYERGFWLAVTSGLGYVLGKIKGVF